MTTLLLELRYAVRQLLRNPGFTLIAVVTLALGIGANAALFGVVDVLLFRPPAGVREPDAVVRLSPRPAASSSPVLTGGRTSYPDYQDLRDGSRSFTSLAAQNQVIVPYGRGAEARQVRVDFVSSNYFSTLGVIPTVGGFFRGDDRGAAPGAVVSHAFWQREFGGDPGVTDETIQLGTQRVPVIGVAPEEFRGVDVEAVDVWVPLALREPVLYGRSGSLLESRNNTWLTIFGRLRPGVSPRGAGAEATAVFRGIVWEAAPGEIPPDRSAWSVGVAPITDHFGGSGSGESPVPVWLLGVTGALLLIACANIANLLLARGTIRRRELAIRMAVGAGRGRIVRQLVIENLVLALLAGAVGALIAVWSASLLKLLPLPDSLPPVVGLRVFLFTLAVAVAAGLLFGVAPALASSRFGLDSELRASSTGATPRRSRLRSALVVGQLATSLVLLVGAGLFLESLQNVRHIDLGWDIDHVLVVRANLYGAGYSEVRIADLWRRAEERLDALPSVAGVSLAESTPFSGSGSTSTILPGQEKDEMRLTESNRVQPGYFQTMGIPLIEGRGLEASDRAEDARTAVIDGAMARLYWPGESAVGKCFQLGPNGPCIRVVGVVGSTRHHEIQEAPRPEFYRVLGDSPGSTANATLHVRTIGDPGNEIETIRRELLALDPDLPFVNVQPLTELIAPQLAPWRMAALVFTLFGALAVLLAAVGLYGVVSFVVAQRTNEIGVRTALGADRRDIIRLVTGQGARAIALGVVLGVVGALATARVLESRFFGVSFYDPAVYLAVVLALVACGWLASWIPARHATRVDPVVALRAE